MNGLAAFERNPFFHYSPGEGGGVLHDPHHKRTIWMDPQAVRLWEFLAVPRGESDFACFLGAFVYDALPILRGLELIVDARHIPVRGFDAPLSAAPRFEVLDGPPLPLQT